MQKPARREGAFYPPVVRALLNAGPPHDLKFPFWVGPAFVPRGPYFVKAEKRFHCVRASAPGANPLVLVRFGGVGGYVVEC